MSQWVIKGLGTGIKTTRYPRVMETATGTSPGLPAPTEMLGEAAQSLLARCPTRALEPASGGIDVELRQCIHCFRCARGTDNPVEWDPGYECSAAVNHREREADGFSAAFRRSLHILVVDAGDCGACLNEVKQLNNPYYNMHRLGFFLTPSPRHADVMLVVGAVTDHMRFVLQRIYDAMPTPKRVVAVGACAVSGGVFADSFVCARGLTDLLPVDVEVP